MYCVYNYLKNEKYTSDTLQGVREKTSCATGIWVLTIERIFIESVCNSPGKKRPRKTSLVTETKLNNKIKIELRVLLCHTELRWSRTQNDWKVLIDKHEIRSLFRKKPILL